MSKGCIRCSRLTHEQLRCLPDEAHSEKIRTLAQAIEVLTDRIAALERAIKRNERELIFSSMTQIGK